MVVDSQFASSDAVVVDLLRQHEAMTVSQLAASLDVTATAVRQRLNRLTGQGLVERRTVKAPRGRPSHYYALTEAGRRLCGNNYHDLATVLWDEIRAIEDPEVKRGLLQRLAHRMAQKYAGQVRGETVVERMNSLAALYRERRVPLHVEGQVHGECQIHGKGQGESQSLPVLQAKACPYPELAAQDRSVCAMERMMFSELVDANLRLTECRLDGGACCTFE
jgi:DeoR family transcriptional regulator, suf operon transcriptional repressor